MKKIQWLLLAFLPVWSSSCEDQYDICDQNKSVNFKGVFYKRSGAAELETPVQSLTITPLGSGATIYSQQPSISSFVFSLNPVLDSAKYVFQIDNSGVKDTVTITYRSQQQNLSRECGDIITHTLTNARTTTNNIDSVKITNIKVDNVLSGNMKLYF